MPKRGTYSGMLTPTNSTPVTALIPGREAEMTMNNTGGAVFKLGALAQVRRFLILGAMGDTYYASEKAIKADNAAALQEAIRTAGVGVVKLVVNVSASGAAPKNEPSLFVLAAVLAYGDTPTRQAAAAAVPRVARTGTHWFQLARYIEDLRGWGKLPTNALAALFTGRSVNDLAYQIIKYGQREGTSMADLLRLTHPIADTQERQAAFQYALRGWPITPSDIRAGVKFNLGRYTPPRFGDTDAVWADAYAQEYAAVQAEITALAGKPVPQSLTKRLETLDSAAFRARWIDEWLARLRLLEAEGDADLRLLWAAHAAQKATSEAEIVRLITDYDLPHEAIPKEWLGKAGVWAALAQRMPMTALIRNLPTLTKHGLLTDRSDLALAAVSKLTNADALQKARVHPIAVLTALRVYESGRSERGDATWEPQRRITSALEDAFYLAFAAVEPSGKRHLLALDTSGSMDWSDIAGMRGVTPAAGSAVMALVTAATEPNTLVKKFSDTLADIAINPGMRLTEVINKVKHASGGGTNISAAFEWAIQTRTPVDTFVIYTDNEVNSGRRHPAQALADYRQKMGIPARLVVVGMTSTGFSVADPKDGGMLDVVGFDATAPQIMGQFSAGAL